MIEIINEPEVLTNSNIKSVAASTPTSCDTTVNVTITIDRKQGDTNLTILATLADATKVSFVNPIDANPISVPANNIVVIPVKNVTGGSLTNFAVFSSIKLFKQGSMEDEKNNQPMVTWPACPAQPCDDCCKLDCKDNITIPGCTDIQKASVDAFISCSGRILELTVNVKNVCPNRKIALAAFLEETVSGNPVIKGVRFKELTSGTTGNPCTNVTTTMCFVLPDTDGKTLCDSRTFKVKVIANYVNIGSFAIPCNICKSTQ